MFEIKRLDDYTDPLYKTKNIVQLIDQEIFWLYDYKIFVFKVCDIKISKIEFNNNIIITLICAPTVKNMCYSYHDEMEFDLNAMEQDIFLTYKAAERMKRKKLMDRQFQMIL